VCVCVCVCVCVRVLIRVALCWAISGRRSGGGADVGDELGFVAQLAVRLEPLEVCGDEMVLAAGQGSTELLFIMRGR
jgi:hypothetical protein